MCSTSRKRRATLSYDGIPGADRFTEIVAISKGQSGDEKYHVSTDAGTFLLVRIGSAAESPRKKAEYDMLARAFAAGVPTPRPVEFGLRMDGSACAITSWCEGTDAEALLPALTPHGRRALGEKSGALLRPIHRIPAPENAEPWGVRFRRKLMSRISAYDAMPDKHPGTELVRAFLLAHQSLLDDRPQTFNHGDFNAGNLIVAPDGTMRAIDFNAFGGGCGDPWWELGESDDPDYLNGQIAGYFGGETPRAYFPLCAYYAAYGALAAVCDTRAGEYGTPADGIARLERALACFDGMRAEVPTWYRPFEMP